jgi:hypothetical protein
VPAGHLVQSAFATVGLNVPGTHCSHIPFRNEYPSLQAHCDKKTLPGGEDEPDGQSVHTVAEETDENLPASHIKHALGSLLTRYPGKQERNDADVLPMMPSAVTLSPDPAVLEVLPDEYGVELHDVGAGVLDDDAAGVLPPLVPDADVLPMLPSAVVAPAPAVLDVLPVGYGKLDVVGAGVVPMLSSAVVVSAHAPAVLELLPVAYGVELDVVGAGVLDDDAAGVVPPLVPDADVLPILLSAAVVSAPAVLEVLPVGYGEPDVLGAGVVPMLPSAVVVSAPAPAVPEVLPVAYGVELDVVGAGVLDDDAAGVLPPCVPDADVLPILLSVVVVSAPAVLDVLPVGYGRLDVVGAGVLPMRPSAVVVSAPAPAVLEVLPVAYGVELDVVGAGVLDDDAAGVLPPLVPDADVLPILLSSVDASAPAVLEVLPVGHGKLDVADADVLPMLPSAVVDSAHAPAVLEVLPVGHGVELDVVGAGVLDDDADDELPPLSPDADVLPILLSAVVVSAPTLLEVLPVGYGKLDVVGASVSAHAPAVPEVLPVAYGVELDVVGAGVLDDEAADVLSPLFPDADVLPMLLSAVVVSAPAVLDVLPVGYGRLDVVSAGLIDDDAAGVLSPLVPDADVLPMLPSAVDATAPTVLEGMPVGYEELDAVGAGVLPIMPSAVVVSAPAPAVPEVLPVAYRVELDVVGAGVLDDDAADVLSPLVPGADVLPILLSAVVVSAPAVLDVLPVGYEKLDVVGAGKLPIMPSAVVVSTHAPAVPEVLPVAYGVELDVVGAGVLDDDAVGVVPPLVPDTDVLPMLLSAVVVSAPAVLDVLPVGYGKIDVVGAGVVPMLPSAVVVSAPAPAVPEVLPVAYGVELDVVGAGVLDDDAAGVLSPPVPDADVLPMLPSAVVVSAPAVLEVLPVAYGVELDVVGVVRPPCSIDDAVPAGVLPPLVPDADVLPILPSAVVVSAPAVLEVLPVGYGKLDVVGPGVLPMLPSAVVVSATAPAVLILLPSAVVDTAPSPTVLQMLFSAVVLSSTAPAVLELLPVAYGVELDVVGATVLDDDAAGVVPPLVPDTDVLPMLPSAVVVSAPAVLDVLPVGYGKIDVVGAGVVPMLPSAVVVSAPAPALPEVLPVAYGVELDVVGTGVLDDDAAGELSPLVPDAFVLPMLPSAVVVSAPAVLEVLPVAYGVELDVVGAGVLDDDAAGVLPPLVPDADVLPILLSAVVVSAPAVLDVLPVGYGKARRCRCRRAPHAALCRRSLRPRSRRAGGAARGVRGRARCCRCRRAR